MAHRASSPPACARVVTETRRRKVPFATMSNAAADEVDHIPTQFVHRSRHLPTLAECFDQNCLQQAQVPNAIENGPAITLSNRTICKISTRN
jgi:hypothetical protein